MLSKAEASVILFKYITRMKKQSSYVIRSVHGDKGAEIFRAFETLNKKVIEITTSRACTLESNGLA